MADRYWVGAGGTWNTANTKWSATSGGSAGASAPTNADDVYIDANSNTGTTAWTITIGASVSMRNFSCNPDAKVTMSPSAGTYGISVAGSWYNPDSTLFAWGGTTPTTGVFSFANQGNVPSNGGNINFNGVSNPYLLLNFSAGNAALGNAATWTLQSALTTATVTSLATNGTRLTHIYGNIDLNGYTLTCGRYSSTGANNRQVIFGSGRMVLITTTALANIIDIGGTGWSSDCSTSGLTGGFQRNTSAANSAALTAYANIGTGAFYANGVSQNGFLPTANAPNFYVNGGIGNITFAGTGGVVWDLDFTGYLGTSGSGPPNNDSLGAYPDAFGICVGNNLTLNANTSTAWYNTAFSFVSNTGIDHTFNTNRVSSVQVAKMAIAAESGNVTFVGNISQTSSDYFQHTSGNWILNGYDQQLGGYRSSNAITRTRRLDFGSANISLNLAANARGVGIEDASGWDCTTTGGGFVQAVNISNAYYTCGNTVALDIATANAPSLFYIESGGPNIQGYWNNLTFSGNRQTPQAADIYLTGNFAVSNVTSNTTTNFSNVNISFVGTQNQTLGGVANKSFALITVDKGPGNISGSITLTSNASSVGNVILNEGTLNLGNQTLTVPDAFESKNWTDRSIIFGTGNIELTSNTADATLLDVWVSGLTCTGTGGFTRNMSVASALNIYGGIAPTDSNALPNMTFTGGSAQITLVDPTFYPDHKFYANNIAFLGTSVVDGLFGIDPSVFVNKNTTLTSGGDYGSIQLVQIGTGTLTTNGQSLLSYSIQCGSNTATLGGALTTTSNIELLQGTFTTANYSVTTPYFRVPGAQVAVLNMGTSTFTISGSSTNAWSVVDSASNVTINSNTSTISMTSGSSKTFTGGSKTYYNLTQAGNGILTIAGNNSFANILNSIQPVTVTFTAGTTQTVTNFGLTGTTGSPVTINSSSAGVPATLSKSSGVVDAQYLAIQDSNATGGATWNALYSTDNGNNTGWNIYSGGAVSSSNFFMMFY